MCDYDGTTRKVRAYRIFSRKLLGEGHLEKPPTKQEFNGSRDRHVGSEDRKQTGIVCFLSLVILNLGLF